MNLQKAITRLLTVIIIMSALLICHPAEAAEQEQVDMASLTPVKITGYCLQGKTANGTPVHEGICAYRKEDIGKFARVYNAAGELIGEYEICDTGRGGVRKGTTVDIWKPTRRECFQLTQNGYIEVFEKEEAEDENVTSD